MTRTGLIAGQRWAHAMYGNVVFKESADMLEADAPAQPMNDFDMRGVLASNLLCWPRLTEAETQNLISFFETVRNTGETHCGKDI